jgi:tetratricopeptide (TPR) repeat protein
MLHLQGKQKKGALRCVTTNTNRTMLRIFILLVFVIPWGALLSAQSPHEMRRDGDKRYSQGAYNEAEERYRKSLEEDPEMKAYFNLGNSLYQQQRFEEAREQYDRAIARTDDPEILGKAYYNKGNSYFGEQKLKESVESYKQSLRYNPDDMDALQNLFLTKQLMRQQKQQQQKQQQQEEGQEQQEQEQQEQEQEQEQQEQEQQEQEQQGQEQSEQEESTDPPSVGENQDSLVTDSLRQQITREELMKLLKAIEEEDKQIQQKLRRGSGSNKKREKDW